ncbi:MAG: hypothetical protein HND48_03520 [Chloroflexi bacterium]|nr:hypothetical protein [Chloroflexota bacterium]
MATVLITVNPVILPEFFLENGGFEIPGLTLTNAHGWSATNVSDAKRKCNKDTDGDGTFDKLFANNGECSLQVTAQATANTTATQKPAFANFQLGDTVVMSAYVSGSSLDASSRIQLIVDYADGSRDKLKIIVPNGTYDFTLMTDSLVAAGTPVDLKLQIKANTGSGKYYVDDITLTGFDTSTRSMTRPAPDVLPVPEPAAPGWRG